MITIPKQIIEEGGGINHKHNMGNHESSTDETLRFLSQKHVFTF